MVGLISGVRADRIAENLNRVQAEIVAAVARSPVARARQDGRQVAVLAATKYVSAEDLPVLSDAGVRLVGENRAQDLEAKVAAHG